MPAGLAFATCLRTAALLVRKLNKTEQERQEESAQVFARRPSDLLFSHANQTTTTTNKNNNLNFWASPHVPIANIRCIQNDTKYPAQ